MDDLSLHEQVKKKHSDLEHLKRSIEQNFNTLEQPLTGISHLGKSALVGFQSQ